MPISEQDVGLWSKPRLEEAERLLALAAACRRPGRFQLEAAIQSAHIERARGGQVDTAAIALLYEGLVQLGPTLGALIGRAAAVGDARGPAAGLALLEDIPSSVVESYQPYWAARAHFCKQLRRGKEAREAFDAAIRLTEDDAVRCFLERMAESPWP